MSVAVGVPFLDGEEVIKRCAKAFTNISQSVQKLMEDKASWGEEGHWLAAAAALCQLVHDLPGGIQILHQCQQKKDDWDTMVTVY